MDIKYARSQALFRVQNVSIANRHASHHGLTLGIGGKLFLAPIDKKTTKVLFSSPFLSFPPHLFGDCSAFV